MCHTPRKRHVRSLWIAVGTALLVPAIAVMSQGSVSQAAPVGTVTNYRSLLHKPSFIVSGPGGNLWFTNYASNSIGRITTAGQITYFTGPGVSGPRGIAAGPDGNVSFTNYDNHTIGRATPAGTITNFMAPGANGPEGIAAGPDGNLWFTNYGGGTIGRITTGGAVTIFTGIGISNPDDITAGPDGNLWFANAANNSIGRITPGGVVANFTAVTINAPSAIASGPDGNLWFTNSGNHTIGRITPQGVVANFTGTGINSPRGITAGPDGNLWFTNYLGDSIGRITPAGIVTTFADPAASYPLGIATGPDGNLWFANYEGNSIHRSTPAGVISTFEGEIVSPGGVATGADGNVWFTNNADNSIGRITPTGVVSKFADPRIAFPYGITAGPDGNVWFTDNTNNSIGRITPAGVMSIFTSPAINAPRQIATGPDGNLWFTNQSNGSIAMVRPSNGFVTKYTSATINAPTGIAAGPDGNMWFTNYGANTIGRITPGGTVSSLPGTGILGPTGITLGPGGDLWFANKSNDSIGRIVAWNGAGYVSMTPSRILDSRTAVGAWNAKLVAGSPKTLQVTGLAGGSYVPPSASAVVMNVAVTAASAGSYLSVWPSGVAQPNTANLNFAAGQTIPNLVTVKVGIGGLVSFANAVGQVHVIADLVGYYDNGAPGPGNLYTGITPTRLLDSRTATGGWNAKLPAGVPRDLNVRQPANPQGVPADATAVIANVTVTAATAGSYLSVWPSGVAQPVASNLNFGANQTIPNLVIVKIGSNDAIRFFNAVGSVHVIVDVVGYFSPTGGSRFHPITPTRVLDDRVGKGLSGPWGPGQTRTLAVGGAAATNVPDSATGLVANVTATAATTGSYITVFPWNISRPTAANLNFGAGQTIPNLVISRLANGNIVGSGAACPINVGCLDIYNELGSVDLIADVVGYYGP